MKRRNEKELKVEIEEKEETEGKEDAPAVTAPKYCVQTKHLREGAAGRKPHFEVVIYHFGQQSNSINILCSAALYMTGTNVTCRC